MSINIENLLEQINRGDDLNELHLNKFSNDLLHNQSSNAACRIFLALCSTQKIVSDEIFERICQVILNDHEQSAKENAIRVIDLLVQNDRSASQSCLYALTKALQNKQSTILRNYASKILCTLIQKQSCIHLNSSLLDVMCDALHDTSITVQKHTLESFEELVQKNPSTISQRVIDNMTAYLSKMGQDINKNYVKCVSITLFFQNLLRQPVKISGALLSIFSEFAVFDASEEKKLLNRFALQILQKVMEHRLIHGNLPDQVFINLSTCFNLKSFEHKELFQHCLRILCTLNDDQLKLTQLNGCLLKSYLKETNLEENLRIYITILFGNLCKLLYKYADGETNATIIEDTIDIFIERLDQDKLLQSSIYVLRNIAEYEQSYLSIYPLHKFVYILNRDDVHKEVRQYACLILRFSVETRQILTNYELDALEKALNDSDSTISLTALQAFQHLFEEYHRNADFIEPYVNKLCTSAAELIFNSNESFTLNALDLLQTVLKHNLKHAFSHDEIANLCIGLQANLDSSIRRSISNILQQIISKRFDVPSYALILLRLEMLTEQFLRKENISTNDCEIFEKNIIECLHDKSFDKRMIPINLLRAIDELLKTNLPKDSRLTSILLQCAENNLNFPIDLIEILFKRFRITKSQILMQILHQIIVQNGQSLSEKFLQQFQEFFVQNSFSSSYTIDILKFLINRNQIQIGINIYSKLIDMLNESSDSYIESVLLETLACALQNPPSNIGLLLNRLLELVEKSFQSTSSTKQTKYSSCLAIHALLRQKVNLSKSTLDLLKKIYEEDDDFESTVNLRDIALTILKEYLPNDNEINDFVNQRELEAKILDYEDPSNRLEAGKRFLSLVQNQNRRLSKFQLANLELSLNFANSSIEYKFIVLSIFQYHSADLEATQITSLFAFINNNQLNTKVIEICKVLVDMKRSFSDEVLQRLTAFVFENSNRALRDSIIDCLEQITKYQSISKPLSDRIRREILSKVLRETKGDLSKKKNACLQLIAERDKLSLNTIDSLEYLLKNPSEMKHIEKEVFDLIDLAIEHHQKLPVTFNGYLSRLIEDTCMNQIQLISTMNRLSIHCEQTFTQEIFDNAQKYFVENFDQSFEILLQGTQNGCHLNPTMIHSLKTNSSSNQHEKVLKILKNQIKHEFLLEDDIIQYLENHFKDYPHLVLNVLKYQPVYQPSSAMQSDLQNLLIKHPFFFQFELILNRIMDLPIQVRLHFTHIFFLLKHMQLDIVTVYPLKLICRQLLCYDLLGQIAQRKKYEKFDEL
ncbi:unnamed protein product, partial [Adineta ricciae]